MSYKPSDTIAFQFTTTSSTGALANADSTPVGVMVENGVDDVTVTVTITSPNTGIYKGIAVIPSDYTVGTNVEIRISATIGGVLTGSVFDFGVIDSKRISDLNDLASGSEMDLVNTPNATAITAIQNGLATPTNITAGTITTVTNLTNNNDKTGYSISGTKQTLDALNDIDGSSVTVTTNNDKTGYALTSDYDPAKTASQAGDEMDLVDAPNATAITAISDGITITSTVDANIVSIYSSEESAANLAASTQTIVIGTVSNYSFLPTETEFEASDITTASTGQYISRIIIFVTGNLKGQMKDITGYSLVGGMGHFTVSDFTSPPINGDTFVII